MTKRNNLVIQVQQKLSTENNLVFAAIIMFKTWWDTIFYFQERNILLSLQLYMNVAFNKEVCWNDTSGMSMQVIQT